MKTTRPIHLAPREPITTPRLLLRRFGQPNDLAQLYAIRSLPEVLQYQTTGLPDADIEATTKWCSRFLPENYHHHYGFLIETRDYPGHVIGSCAVHSYDRPEVGFMFGPEVWGKGYATEMLVALVDSWWRLPRKVVGLKNGNDGNDRDEDELVEETLEGHCRKANVASAEVMEKAGFTLKCAVDPEPKSGQGDDYVYEMKRPARLGIVRT